MTGSKFTIGAFHCCFTYSQHPLFSPTHHLDLAWTWCCALLFPIIIFSIIIVISSTSQCLALFSFQFFWAMKFIILYKLFCISNACAQFVPLLTWGNHVGSLAPLRFAPFLVFLFVLPPSLGSSSFLLVLNYGGRRAAGCSGTPSVHCTRISDY